MGLTSRDGIVPLFLDKDIGGPMARTVADAVAVFEVIAGYDPADPVTADSQGNMPANGYSPFLVRDGLKGARIGVLRQLLTATAHPEVVHLFEQALVDLRRQGAEMVDPVRIPEHDEIPVAARFCVRAIGAP